MHSVFRVRYWGAQMRHSSNCSEWVYNVYGTLQYWMHQLHILQLKLRPLVLFDVLLVLVLEYGYYVYCDYCG